MRLNKIIIFCFLFLVHFNVFAQEYLWQTTFGNGGPLSECGNDIVSDVKGDYYITGYFQNGALFNNKTLTSNGNTDIFIAKYDSHGNSIWLKTFGGGKISPMMANEMGCSLVLDKDGDLYVTGYFSGIINIDSIPLVSKGDDDIFIAKITASGVVSWAKKIGGILQDQPIQLNLGSFGNIYLLGSYNEKISLGSIDLSKSGFNSFLCKIDQRSGDVINAVNLVDSGCYKASCFKTDSNDNLIVAGLFTPKSDNNGLLAQKLENVLISKFSNSGNVAWVKEFNSTDRVTVRALSVNSHNETIVTGAFRNTLDLYDNAISSKGGTDIYVLKLDERGDLLWAKSYGGTDDDEALFLLGGGDEKRLVGKFSSEIQFSSKENALRTHTSDYFEATLAADGNLSNGVCLSVTGSQRIVGVDENYFDSLIFTGSFRGNEYFGDKQLLSNGQDDYFVGKLKKLSVNFNDSVNLDLQTNISVTPNPVKDKFKIIDSSGDYNWAEVVLFDLEGRRVSSFKGPFFETKEYNISILESGLYCLRISVNDEFVNLKLMKE